MSSWEYFNNLTRHVNRHEAGWHMNGMIGDIDINRAGRGRRCTGSPVGVIECDCAPTGVVKDLWDWLVDYPNPTRHVDGT